MQIISRFARILIYIQVNVVLSEWVDLPQFSDKAKIYRFPSIIRSVSIRDSDNTFAAPVTDGLNNVSRWHSPNQRVQFSSFFNEPRVTLSSINIVNEEEEEEEDEDEESGQIESSQTVSNTMDSTVMTESDVTSNDERCENPNNNTQDKNGNEFMDYLPVDLLKQVHNTLKAQPKTLKGKIRFLRSFEKSLLSEIESRLTTSLASKRKARSSDDVDFPSVEGALMIISLLTFAVYLVRLVMAVIHNMHGSNGTQTIFIGRKKRSLESTEEMLRILQYIENFKHTEYGT